MGIEDQIVAALKNEFVWGIVIGIALTWIGTYFSNVSAQRERKILIKSFCTDVIRNLQEVTNDMNAAYERSQLIYEDYLVLLDVEIGVFGRNREHLVHLPETLRVRMRKFVTDMALRRAELAVSVGEYNRLRSIAAGMQANGSGPEAVRMQTQATQQNQLGEEYLRRLVTISKTGDALVTDLTKYSPSWLFA